MRQKLSWGYFAFGGTRLIDVVTWQQRYAQTMLVEGVRLGLSVRAYGLRLTFLAYSSHNVDMNPQTA